MLHPVTYPLYRPTHNYPPGMLSGHRAYSIPRNPCQTHSGVSSVQSEPSLLQFNGGRPWDGLVWNPGRISWCQESGSGEAISVHILYIYCVDPVAGWLMSKSLHVAGWKDGFEGSEWTMAVQWREGRGGYTIYTLEIKEYQPQCVLYKDITPRPPRQKFTY